MIKSVMVDGEEALKLMVDGKVAWERGGLPAGYQKCQYLQSTGEQWIDTMITPIFGDEIVVVAGANLSLGDFRPFGSGSKNQVAITLLSSYQDRVYYKYFQGNTDAMYLFNTFFGNDFALKTIKLDSSGMYIDGNRLGDISNDYMDTDTTMYIFRIRNTMSCVARISNFSIARNGENMIDMIACIDPSGVPCMYDTVSKHPFYNQGTGEFLYELV